MSAAGFLAVLLATLAPQGERIRAEGPMPALVRLGQATQITLIAEGRAELPAPRAPVVDGAGVELSAPSSFQQMTYDGVRRTMRVEVRYVLTITPWREGRFTVPPIEWPLAAGRVERTQEFTFECVKDLRGAERAFVQVRPLAARVYVGEPLRVDVDFGVDAALTPLVLRTARGQEYVDLELQAGWLGTLPDTTPVEVPFAQGEQGLYVVANGGLAAALAPEMVERQGRRYSRFVLRRAFLPTAPGRLRLEAPLLRYRVESATDRDDFTARFGGRPLPRKEEYFAYGEPVEVEVLPLPDAGRPRAFSGAVGRFTIDAALDRPAVRVGNSVKLRVTIAGTGNLEFLGLPEYQPGGGLHLLGRTEARGSDKVEAVYDLTPTTATVREVPPVHWNYFDTTPGRERYVEVATRALPLEVQPLPAGEGLRPLVTDTVVPGRDDVFDLIPLDRGAPVVVAPWPGPWVRGVAVLAPWLAALGLAGFLGWRRRVRADVAGARARRAAQSFADALRAGMAPDQALAGYLSDRLGCPPAALVGPDLLERLARCGVEPGLADEIRSALESGVAARYGGGGEVAAAPFAALVRRLEGVALRRLALLWLVGLLTAGAAGAQDPVRAQELYRRGEHAAAAEAFAAAAERPDPDRRVLYNLGNALYRQGRHAEALLAYEQARLGMPRDPELQANLALVRGRLELPGDEGGPFFAGLARARESFTPLETVALAVLANLWAALLLLLGWRRTAARFLGLAILVPALLLALEVLWFAPARPPRGIVLRDRSELAAEPRAGLPALLTLRAGAEVDVLGEGPSWTEVRVRGRRGYLPRGTVGVVR
ncbi:MAG: BatD family protein [Planctomycetes bacterium]|nr:BatD family protein [Planctomycetota bacterium]